MKPLRLSDVRVRVAPVGADPLDPDVEWVDVGTLEEGSVMLGDPTGEDASVVWSARVSRDPIDGWDWAAWLDCRTGESGPLIEVEPTSVVDAPVDDTPHASAADPTHL